MLSLNRLFGLDSDGSRPRREARPRRMPRAQFTLESLEERDLKSNIPGVSMQYGMLTIAATQASHNTASVTIDPSNQMLKVSLNGQSTEFNQGDVWTVNFLGSQGGSDTFSNDTNLSETAFGYGGNNQFVGGSSFNLVFLYGDHNSFDARGAYSYTFAYNGPNDIIPAYSNEQVFSYSYDSSWF